MPCYRFIIFGVGKDVGGVRFPILDRVSKYDTFIFYGSLVCFSVKLPLILPLIVLLLNASANLV